MLYKTVVQCCPGSGMLYKCCSVLSQVQVCSARLCYQGQGYCTGMFLLFTFRAFVSRLVCVRVRDNVTIHHHHHHQSFNREGRWGTADDFATSFLHFSLFFTALSDLPNSRPVHSLMSSSHLFLCPPCLLPPFTVPCKMVLARPDERET